MQTPKTQPSLHEKAYAHLRGAIVAGDLAPGSALSEVSVARQLGISRGPLREAVRRLMAEGLLRHTPKGGTTVVEFSRRDIDEIYELREALEVYAAGRAAEHGLNPSELETLRGLANEILVLRDGATALGSTVLSGEAMKRFIRLDFQFHNTVVRAAANARILKAVTDTRVLLNVFALRRNGHSIAQLAEIHRYHSEVTAAIARRDPAEATRLLGEHIRVSKQERLREFDEREREVALSSCAAHETRSW